MARRLTAASDRDRFEAFVGAAFSQLDAPAIINDLADLEAPPPYQVRIKVFYAEQDVRVLFDQFVDGDLVRPLVVRGLGFKISGTVGGSNPRQVTARFAVLQTKRSHVYALVTVSTADQWSFLRRWVRSRYPSLVPIFLSQHELIEGIQLLRKANKSYKVRVRELSAKEVIDSSRSKARSVREWTDEELRDVLAQVADRRQVLTSLTLGFHKAIDSEVDVVPSLVARITKRGELALTGRFLVAWESIVQHVADVGSNKLLFYSRRGLRQRQYRAAPVEIRFATPVFSDVDDVRALTGILKRYPHSMHSVQHGNPYIHMSIADVFDGSAFDVWAVSAQALVLIPRLKSTEAAFERLVHYVFDNFREGRVSDYSGP